MRFVHKYGFSTIAGLPILLTTTIRQEEKMTKAQNDMKSLRDSISTLSATIKGN